MNIREIFVMQMPIKPFLAVLIGLILLLSFSCSDDDDEDAILSRDASGVGGGGSSGCDDGCDDDDDTADDDTADDDTADDDDTAGDYPVVALVYKSYPGTVVGFAELMDTYGGFEHFMISESSVTATDFSDTDLIVVTSDTTWSNLDAVDLIIDALTLPVLALGQGGLILYEKGGLTTGWNSQGTIYDQEDAATVEMPGHSIFSGPHNVDVEDSLVGLFTQSVVLYAVPTYQFSENVDLLASSFQDDERSAIQLEGSRFMSWGFNFGAGNLSGNGANLLMNCIDWLAD
jgi:hypothetical protein